MAQRNFPVRLLPILLGLLVVGFLTVKGCQEGPFGRRQHVAINAQQEAALGAQAFREVLATADVVRDGPAVAAVEGVARRLTVAAVADPVLAAVKQKRQQFDWAVRVVRGKEVNAFCLPGGKIVVYTAILPVCETEAGLATVMGHEIAHALAHHGAERMYQQQVAQVGVLAAGASLGEMDPAQRQQIMVAINAGAQFGILKYSRNHESEADHMGLLMMASAGYDPAEAMKFWERMGAASRGRGQPPEFLSTHPSHATRIRDLTGWQSEAEPLYASSEKQPDRRLPSVR
jgi:metalloendopeptidase OMA1, mitochondrial